MKKTSSKTKPNLVADPAVFLWNLGRFIGTLGGGALFTTFAPPVEPFAIVPVAVMAIAAFAWLVGFLLGQRWNLRHALRTYYKRLLTVAVVFSLLLVGTLIAYVNLWNTHTVSYYGTRLCIGSELTDGGKQYFTKNPSASNERAVWDAAGRPEDIWTSESVVTCRSTLWMVFLPLIFLVVFPVVLTAYSMRPQG